MPDLQLAFKPDAADAQRRLRAYWQVDLIDRAGVNIGAPRDGLNPPWRSLIVAEDFDMPGAIDKFEAWASRMFFGGESMPALMPNFGKEKRGLCFIPEPENPCRSSRPFRRAPPRS